MLLLASLPVNIYTHNTHTNKHTHTQICKCTHTHAHAHTHNIRTQKYILYNPSKTRIFKVHRILITVPLEKNDCI